MSSVKASVNVQEICARIAFGNLTDAELNLVREALIVGRKSVVNSVKRSLKVGDTVSFVSSRTGVKMFGRVRKIAVKFVTVDCGVDAIWRVPANMLTKTGPL